MPLSDAGKLQSLVDIRTEITDDESDELRLESALQLLAHVKILSEAPDYGSKVSKLEQRLRHYSPEDPLSPQMRTIRIVDSLAEPGNLKAL